MINAKELRIGNWVNAKFMTDDFNFQVMEIRTSSEGYCMSQTPNISYHENTLHGIPLTVAWLLKFGFECDKYPNYIQYKKYVKDFKLIYKIIARNGLTEFWLEGNGSYDEYGETDLTDICKCVHQLQNLYFALTGQEVTTNKI